MPCMLSLLHIHANVDFVPIACKLISLTFVSLPELMFFYHCIKVGALMIT